MTIHATLTMADAIRSVLTLLEVIYVHATLDMSLTLMKELVTVNDSDAFVRACYDLLSTDTNECGSNNGGCAQTCTNIIGSYYCSCGTGYSLASNNHGCNGNNDNLYQLHYFKDISM